MRMHRYASLWLSALTLVVTLVSSPLAFSEPDSKTRQAIEEWIAILKDPHTDVPKINAAVRNLTYLKAGKEDWVRVKLLDILENNKFTNSARFYDLLNVYLPNFQLDAKEVRAVLGSYSRLPKHFAASENFASVIKNARFTADGAETLIAGLLTDFDFSSRQLYALAHEFRLSSAFATMPERILTRAGAVSIALSESERIMLASLAVFHGRTESPAVTDAILGGLHSKDKVIIATAAQGAKDLKNPDVRFKLWLDRVLDSRVISSSAIANLMEAWSINDERSLNRLATLLRTEQSADEASAIIERLHAAESLPMAAHADALAYLDRVPGSQGALSLLNHHKPRDPQTIEYAAKSLSVPDTGGQKLALEILAGAEPLDEHIQHILAKGLFEGGPDSTLHVGKILKNRGHDGLEAVLMSELRKGKRARHLEQIAQLIIQSGPWTEDFDSLLKALSQSRKKDVAAAARHVLQTGRNLLPAGPGDAEEILLKQLTDPDHAKKLRAIQSLSGFQGNEHIAHTLIKRLAAEKGVELRVELVSTLSKLGVHDVRVQMALWDVVNRDSGLATLNAVKALKMIKPIDPALYPTISDILARESNLQHVNVFAILKEHQPLDHGLQVLLTNAYFKYNPNGSTAFYHWLVESGGITPDFIEGQALAALDSPDPRVRAGAANIRFSESAGGAETTARALLTEKDRAVRNVLLRTLLDSEPNGYLSQSALLEIFENGPNSSMRKAFEKLKAAGKLDVTHLPRLEKIMSWGYDRRGLEAAALIKYVQDVGAEETGRLVKLIPKLDRPTSFALVNVLGSLNSEFVVADALALLKRAETLTMLKSSDPFVREMGAKLLRGSRAAEADVQGVIYLALQKERNIAVRGQLWEAARGHVWAEEMPASASYLEAALTSPFDREHRGLVLEVMSGWSEKSPTLLPVLARFKGRMTHPDQQRAGAIHEHALAMNPDYADFADAVPEACVPGRLSKLWSLIKKPKR